MKYWTLCDNERGEGPGYNFATRYEAITTAKNLYKIGVFSSVSVEVDTPLGFLTIWQNGMEV